MNKPHKHAALIKAWADGAKIQYYSIVVNKWFDCTANRPTWNDDVQYRIKPSIKYRVALMYNGEDYWVSSTIDAAHALSEDINFSRWLTDWVEVEG